MISSETNHRFTIPWQSLPPQLQTSGRVAPALSTINWPAGRMAKDAVARLGACWANGVQPPTASFAGR